MVFVRKSPGRSGSVKVQIAERRAGRDVVLEHVGTARGEAEPAVLVLARIIEPTSKADSVRVLEEIGVEHASLRTMFRSLRRAAVGGYRDTVAAACFAHAAASGDVSLCLYDVTTLYFEAEHEDELRKVGFWASSGLAEVSEPRESTGYERAEAMPSCPPMSFTQMEDPSRSATSPWRW